jgi:hypothetical protein
MNSLRQLIQLKQTKEPTPFDAPRYPIRSFDDVGPLLRERLLCIRQKTDEVFGPGVRLWLFGSQLKGHSGSGKPDIDLYFHRNDILELETYDKLLEIAKSVSYAVDFSFVNAEIHHQQHRTHKPVEI